MCCYAVSAECEVPRKVVAASPLALLQPFVLLRLLGQHLHFF